MDEIGGPPVGQDNGVTQAAAAPQPRAARRPATAAQPPPEAEYNAFYELMYPELAKFGYACCRDWDDSYDAAQTVMIRVAKLWYQIENHRAYAYRVFRRVLAKILEKRHDQGRCMPCGELPEQRYRDPAFDVHEGQQWVTAKLAQLPPLQQAVMTALLQEKTYAEFVAEQEQAAADTRGRAGLEHAAAREQWVLKKVAAARKNAQLAKQNMRVDSELRDLVRSPRPSDDPTTRKETR